MNPLRKEKLRDTWSVLRSQRKQQQQKAISIGIKNCNSFFPLAFASIFQLLHQKENLALWMFKRLGISFSI